jgi:hypothetical protein
MSEDKREQRNQVFVPQVTQVAPVQQALPTGVDPRVPHQTALEKAKSDFGIDIPIEQVPLPSSGLVYPSTSTLAGRDTVDIRVMTAHEEDILTSSAYLKKGTVITELLKSCLIDKTIDPLDLLVGDRNALMVAIRITGYGSDYTVEVECNECNVKSECTFNLGELPIRRLSINPVSSGMNLFEFALPATKKVVRFKFLTGRDEQTIVETTQKQKKLGMNTDQSVTTNLLYSIQAIDGDEKRDRIAGFVRMMPARDSLALRSFIRDSEPGIIMKQEVECPSCGRTEVIGMPISTSFLWPGTER